MTRRGSMCVHVYIHTYIYFHACSRCWLNVNKWQLLVENDREVLCSVNGDWFLSFVSPYMIISEALFKWNNKGRYVEPFWLLILLKCLGKYHPLVWHIQLTHIHTCEEQPACCQNWPILYLHIPAKAHRNWKCLHLFNINKSWYSEKNKTLARSWTILL